MPLIEIRHRSLHIVVSEPPLGVEDVRPDVTIFFVHGAMASLEQWRFQVAAVANRFRVVSYDYFGCGNSPRLLDSWESYSTEEHLADLLAVFDKYKSKYNFAVGHSFGSNQVLRLAKARGEGLQGAILVAPALMKDGGHPIFYLPEFILNWLQPSLSKAFIEMALHPNTKAGLTEAHKELVKYASERSNTNSMHVAKSFYRQIKFVKREEVVAIAPRLPILIICGDGDKLTPETMGRQIMQWLNERPQAVKTEFEIVGPASHQVMEEQPEAVNALMVRFIQSHL